MVPMMRRLFTVALAAATLTALAPPAGHAEPVPGNTQAGASGDGKNYQAYVQTQVQLSGSGYQGSGSPGQEIKVWNGPPCWYEPRFTYEEMVRWIESIDNAWNNLNADQRAAAEGWFKVSLDDIKQYEGQEGKIFWFLVDNGTQEGKQCVQEKGGEWSWIYVGGQPPTNGSDDILDLSDLARMARANLVVPDPQITLNPPGGRSYVGLETWVGVAEQEPVEVTASVPNFPGLSVTLTATPGPVTIEADTEDIEKRDGQVNCPIYQKGMKEDEGCWIRFLRASLGSPYTITVRREWAVSVNVPVDLDEEDLPPGQGEATATVDIDEIQSTVVRG